MRLGLLRAEGAAQVLPRRAKARIPDPLLSALAAVGKAEEVRAPVRELVEEGSDLPTGLRKHRELLHGLPRRHEPADTRLVLFCPLRRPGSSR